MAWTPAMDIPNDQARRLSPSASHEEATIKWDPGNKITYNLIYMLVQLPHQSTGDESATAACNRLKIP
eukprot:1159244-Pelagomonas_calceolata.AAC.4